MKVSYRFSARGCRIMFHISESLLRFIFLTVSDRTEAAPSVALSFVHAPKMSPLPRNGIGLFSQAPFQYETTLNPITTRQQVALIAEDEAEDGDLLVVEP